MKKYNHQEIEKKWQDYWRKDNIYKARDLDQKPKFYCLDMFPYPSGEGLHVGHWRGLVLSDVIARFQMLNGKNVLHPMGWDAFGLPAENAAINVKLHPKIYTKKAIEKFKKQLIQIGAMFDWSREINTSDPDYYKWTQWIFLQLYKNKLAYRKKAPVNWCPSCQTVLANEQVISGNCERCDSKVIQKDLTQWFFKITDFSESLLKDLDDLNWPEKTKTLQRNWIGKSQGALVKFLISNSQFSIEVFTTRVDTLFGCTYMVLAPENELITKIKEKISNWKEVSNYIDQSKNKSNLERTELQKQKTGVEIKGLKAINPINNEEVEVWVADYVLSSYGTGAVMAVPAHDQRDFEFAKKYDIEIKQVIAPEISYYKTPPQKGLKWVERDAVESIIYNPKTKKYMCLEWKKLPWTCFITGGIDKDENPVEAAKREIHEETGYKNLRFIKHLGKTRLRFHAAHKNCNRLGNYIGLLFELKNEEKDEPTDKEKKIHEVIWLSREEITEKRMICASYEHWIKVIDNKESAFENYGSLINSGSFSKLNSKEASNKIIEKLKEKNLGDFATNYRLRDWLISRQRYWGTPIPIIYCHKCGQVPIPEKDLPVKLPKNVEFKPKGDSPLKQSKEFLNVKCPKCLGSAQRETDTMDTFVCSSWYYLRYLDPKNTKNIANDKNLNYWMPVDFYVGGIEHAVLHLLYARFISKALTKLKIIDCNPKGEPFKKLFNIGMVYLHGKKMSKSKGNVILPDELIEKYGSDALRGYELFVGPPDQDSQWQTNGISGIYRFLEKVWHFFSQEFSENQKQDIFIEKSIKTITNEIETIKPNTAISHLMELFNYLKKEKEISLSYARKINILLSPFFPHISEEVWQKLGNNQSIFKESWPKYDGTIIKDQKITIAIQINGKLKDTLKIEEYAKQDDVQNVATKRTKVAKALENKKITKTIYISGRIINFVIE